MSRLQRLKEYSDPMKGPHGAASAQENIDHWSARATSNSAVAPRASDGPMRLPSTGKRMGTRSTEMKPKASRNADARAVAKADKNDIGSSFMRDLRRNA